MEANSLRAIGPGEPEVCVVLVGADPELDGAIGAQEQRPDDELRARDVRTGIIEAAGRQSRWIWLLDGTAVPRPDTLSELLSAGAVEICGQTPTLVASTVITGAGELVAAHVPWGRHGEVDVALDAVECHAVPIRAAAGGSLLVSGAMTRAHPPPRSGVPPQVATLGWTARILRTTIGLLVPASPVLARLPATARRDARGDSSAEVRAGVALLRAQAWTTRERLRLGGETIALAARLVTSGRSTPISVASAAIGGIRNPA
jgi:hypothetical protein